VKRSEVMSIGFCGSIILINHTIDELVNLSYDIQNEATINKIGCKMGGNVSEEVYELYSDFLGRECIAFELMDSPLDNYAEELFQPNLNAKVTKYVEEFNSNMTKNLVKIKRILERILNSSIVESVNVDINYLLCDKKQQVELVLDQLLDYILMEYQENGYFAPVVSFKIVKPE